MEKQWNYFVKSSQSDFDFNIHNIYIGYQNPNECIPIKQELKPISILQFIVRGKGSFAIDGHGFSKVEEGDVFYLPRGIGVSYWADSSDPYEYYYIAIDSIQNDKFFESIGFTVNKPVVKMKDDKVFKLVKEIYNECKNTGVPEMFHSISLLYELFSTLAQNDDESGNKSIVKNDYIENALVYMNSNYARDINVNKIAHAINLDRSYFSTLFTTYMGMAPSRYLTELRVSQACKLLSTSKTITEIAEITGFSSASIFGIHFKRVMKITPHEYRKRLQKKDGEKNE